MKAIPDDREMSRSLDRCFICSAEKFPSIIKVRMSWSLEYIVSCRARGENNYTLFVLGLPVHRKVYAGLWAGRAKDGHRTIRDGRLIFPVAKPMFYPVLEVSPLSGRP